MGLYTVQCTVKFIWLADFVFLLYVAQRGQSARLFLQSSELAPQPQEMVSPLLWFGGGTLACGWGGHFTELMWPRKVTLIQHKVTLISQSDFKSYSAASIGFLLILWWRPFKMKQQKNSEPPVCPYESIEPNLATQFEWSVNTFNAAKMSFQTCLCIFCHRGME